MARSFFIGLRLRKISPEINDLVRIIFLFFIMIFILISKLFINPYTTGSVARRLGVNVLSITMETLE